MLRVICATGNAEKFAIGKRICAEFDIELVQAPADIDEIQGSDPEKIASHKARAAFEFLQKPVVVSDDSWSIPALGGFPGAYMKDVNRWLKPEDFLRLMHGVTDRRVYLHQYLAYCDGATTTVFGHDIPGEILHEARGVGSDTSAKIIALASDNGLTISEVRDSGMTHGLEHPNKEGSAWHAFAKWYKEKERSS